VQDAVALLAERKFSELPVVDEHGRPVGLVDVTDVVGWKAEDPVAAATLATVRIFPNQGAA
jgi:arabinose-5-phosphate isomerase